ncbi:NADPH-cytochrome P450 oxidoreductase [Nitzschia inconspicua]|uniref:NADPH-cytochrome P450 oxidoreductase n=1 Tax=Nitzschia inconspicua TaxID=303405 RepID=A0A9K3L464_9STRA|nr:NADPH-cytochrome P450 oxidoreductase [Nitzschia inconspicua]
MGDVVSQSSSSLPLVVVATGCLTVALVGALFVVRNEQRKKRAKEMEEGIHANGALKSDTIIDKEKYPGGRISIYYATQTGTAESFAQQLEREGPDHGFYIHVVDIEEAQLDKLKDVSPYGTVDDTDLDGNNNPRAIILASTYGEGEPTDNATAIVNACKEALEDGSGHDLLKGLDYAVFGLGNREYELFNAMGKYFDATFEQLGANRIFMLGLGDDNDDLEADFEKWKDQLWKSLKERYLSSTEQQQALVKARKQQQGRSSIPDCEYAIEWQHTNAKNISTQTTQSLDRVHGSSRHYFTAIDCPVSLVRELRSPKDSGSTVHIELDISQQLDLKYETADNLGVIPCNSPSVVDSVARSLGYDLDAVFSLKAPLSSSNGTTPHEWHGDPFPMPLTVRECLTRYLDLTSAPRRSDLKLLSLYAKDPVDRRALERLSSKEGKQDYKEKITESYVGLVELLKLCPSLEIPLEHLISFCHFMLPRFYTISSCSQVFPDSIHLTVAVTQELRKDGTIFEGVCSTHIAKSGQSQMPLRVFVRPSSFRLPTDATKPILMIGPGTGIAPMRALLQQRRHQQLVEKKAVGSNVLYFGCKRKDQDYLYEDELLRYKDEGILTELHLAFSRQDPSKKVYVQHLLKEQAEATWKLLHDGGAYIYVCGGVKMGHDVTETLKEIVSTQGQMSFEKATSYLSQLSNQGRYVQELWS